MSFTAPLDRLSTSLGQPGLHPQDTLADCIDAALPQTQCTRCGYPDCRAYAQAIAAGLADINRCPPGGDEGIVRLAHITGQPVIALDTGRGFEAPRLLAVIDETWCIGCTLCIKACPVDCIIGAPKRMHTVIDADCTGCELCVPACPVDCIALIPVTGSQTGWAAWSSVQADQARVQYQQRQQRSQRLQRDNEARLAAKAEAKLADLPSHTRHTDPAVIDKKRAVIEAALARARAAKLAPKGAA